MLTRVAMLTAALAIAFGSQGFAGGDDYDASNDVEGAGPAYFGFVRDHRGSPVSDAQVVLRPKMVELEGSLGEQRKKVIDCEGKLTVVQGRMEEIQRAMQKATAERP